MPTIGFVTSTSFTDGRVGPWRDPKELSVVAGEVVEAFEAAWSASDDWTELEDALTRLDDAKQDLRDADDREAREEARDEAADAQDLADTHGEAILRWFDSLRLPLLGYTTDHSSKSERQTLLEELVRDFIAPLPADVAQDALPPFQFRSAPTEPDHQADARQQASHEFSPRKPLVLAVCATISAAVIPILAVRTLSVLGLLAGIVWWFAQAKQRRTREIRLEEISRDDYAAAVGKHANARQEALALWEASKRAWDAERARLIAIRDREHERVLDEAKTAWLQHQELLRSRLAALDNLCSGDATVATLEALCRQLAGLLTPIPVVGFVQMDGVTLSVTLSLPPVTLVPPLAISKSPKGRIVGKEMSDRARRELIADAAAGSLLLAGNQCLKAVSTVDVVEVIGLSDWSDDAWLGEPVECARFSLRRDDSDALENVTERAKDAAARLGAKLRLTDNALYQRTERKPANGRKALIDYEFVQVSARWPGTCFVCGGEVGEDTRLDAHLFVRRTVIGDKWAVVHPGCSPVQTQETKKATAERFGGQRFALLAAVAGA